MTKKTTWQYSAAVIVSVIAAIGAAELYLASRAQARPILPFYNRLYPYVMFRPHEKASYISADHTAMSHHTRNVEHYTNEDGFRVPAPDYVIPKEKPPGQLRIAFLGGSAVQLGSTFETTLPGALAHLLAERHRDRGIEVINAGIQSCVSRQSLAHFLFSLADYHPDIVILYDGVNDLGLPLTYESRANFPYNFQTMEEAWEAYRTEHQASLFRVLLDRSHLAAAWRARFESPEERRTTDLSKGSGLGPNAIPARTVIDDHDFVKNHVAGYLSNWTKLIELSGSYNYKAVCVLQPTAALEHKYAVTTMMEEFNLEEEAALEWHQALSVLYEEASRQIDELRERHPAAVFLDLKDDLAPAEEYFWDLVHVYDEINDLLAKRIYEEVDFIPVSASESRKPAND